MTTPSLILFSAMSTLSICRCSAFCVSLKIISGRIPMTESITQDTCATTQFFVHLVGVLVHRVPAVVHIAARLPTPFSAALLSSGPSPGAPPQVMVSFSCPANFRGRVNGIAATVSSAARVFCPTAATMAYAWHRPPSPASPLWYVLGRGPSSSTVGDW